MHRHQPCRRSARSRSRLTRLNNTPGSCSCQKPHWQPAPPKTLPGPTPASPRWKPGDQPPNRVRVPVSSTRPALVHAHAVSSQLTPVHRHQPCRRSAHSRSRLARLNNTPGSCSCQKPHWQTAPPKTLPGPTPASPRWKRGVNRSTRCHSPHARPWHRWPPDSRWWFHVKQARQRDCANLGGFT